MARILVNTSVGQEFWQDVQEFGKTTKYSKEHERLKAAALFGIRVANLLDEYEKRKADLDPSSAEAIDISDKAFKHLSALLRHVRLGHLSWD
jgi:hypothetical protein